jgi:hypothetical protein
VRAELAPTRHGRRGSRGPATVLAAGALIMGATMLTGCASVRDTVPGCGDPLRMAIIAQSVPGAAYIPCIRQLPQGWSTSAFDPGNGGTRFALDSDRAPGAPVIVQLTARCSVGGAPPTQPRADGVRTYERLISTSPRTAGALYDVFPGGCITYRFTFVLGPSIALIQQFESAVGLYSRQQLRLDLKRKLGVELTP